MVTVSDAGHSKRLLPAVAQKLELLKLYVRHFSPSWMVITMGTGSMATTLHTFPFSFPGQESLALAVWTLNVALFSAFLCLLLSRLVCYPGSALELLEQPNQSLSFGTLPMSISVITGGVATMLVPRYHEPAMTAAYVMTWANLPLVATVALLVPFYMFAVHDLSMFAMTAMWLVPVIPGTAAASITGAVSMAHAHHDQAVTLLYLGICMLAVGLALSYHVLTLYYQRLISHNLPPREVIVSSFIPVGAISMGGWALLNLAGAAEVHVRAFYLHQPGSEQDSAWLDVVLPNCMAAAGVLALCLWAYSGWWLLLAVSSVAHTLRQGIPFTLGWWGAVFPLGTFAGTTLALGHTFRCNAFTIAGAVISCCQVSVWLFVATMTIHKGWAGDLFHPPCLSPPTSVDETLAVPASVMELEQQLSKPPPLLINQAMLANLCKPVLPDMMLSDRVQCCRPPGAPGDLLGASTGVLSDQSGLLPNPSTLAAAPGAAATPQGRAQVGSQRCFSRSDSSMGMPGYLPTVPAALLRADTFEWRIAQCQQEQDRLAGLERVL